MQTNDDQPSLASVRIRSAANLIRFSVAVDGGGPLFCAAVHERGTGFAGMLCAVTQNLSSPRDRFGGHIEGLQ